MFDILFGWRKASKCKKLIRRVQCRLKLLKNKRSCIVKQLRADVAELLRHGHEKSAFDRVEQLLKDESMVEAYDLIEKFCEFIINNLCYIRKHKDCPKDINEAVSTLIFASARFGDLQELLSIRKLFQERYGHRFASAALELHQGNFVNHQIRESISKKNVPDEVKFKLLDEIGRTCVEPGLLLLEYRPELQEERETKPIGKKISSSDFQKHNDDNGLEILISNTEETQGKTVYIDLSSEKQTIFESPSDSYKFTAVQNSAHIIEEKLAKSLQHNDTVKFTVSEFIGETNGGGTADESSSETSVRLPEEMIYLDDIDEFVSPLSKDGNCQDQRLFMFKSSAIALKPEIDYVIENDLKAKIIPPNDKVSTKSRKTRKAGGKRLRRSVSIENRDMNDVEYASYYYGDRLSNYKAKSLNRRKHQKKISVKDENGSQEHEKYTCSFEVKNSLSFVKYREKELRCRETATSKVFTGHSLYGERDEQSHLRAMSMPFERPKENPTENVLRSQSFPIEQINGSSCYRHIHPKLPDYDELAAKFMALKKANFQPF